MTDMATMKFPARKVWMKTYGCQMNYHDSERIFSNLSKLNFAQTSERDEADLLIFNTCAVRDLANQKFYSHLGETKRLKKNNKEIKIGVCGCIAQTDGADLIKKYPQLDFAFGTDVIDSVNDFVFRLYSGENKFHVNTWDRSSDYSIETQITHGDPRAFVNIIKGCDKFCSYCIVPFTRGREKSRRLKEVVDDVRRLVEVQGIKEVTLLGQNVNSYGKENKESLAQLISALDEVNGLNLIRYTTSHPYDVSDELVAIHGSAKKLSKHLHLPVQSGSNTVLQRMLRQYTAEHYLGLLEKLRKSNPNIVISSDIIAGFPNETRSEHEDTLKLLKAAQFDFIYSYAFSVRNGTKAQRMEDVLTNDIRGERLREIQAYQLKIQSGIRSEMVGKRFVGLIEGSREMKGQSKWKARTDCSRIVHIEQNEGDDLKWHWVEVEITEATALSCQGIITQDFGR
jgi:tRNA-2-methylthio-N6-dimethylallyladenosine synthase